MFAKSFLLSTLLGLSAIVRTDIAHATTILPTDFPSMVAASPLIVHGTVVDVRAQATAGRRTIESIVTLAVVDRLKGPDVSRVVFRVPNGQLGRYRRITVGAPEFTIGDEVVLFLDGRPPIVPTPYGLNQGVYRVHRAGGRAIVTPPIVAGAGRVVRGDPARRPVAVEAFARQVRTMAEQR